MLLLCKIHNSVYFTQASQEQLPQALDEAYYALYQCLAHLHHSLAAYPTASAVRLALNSDTLRQLLCAWAGYGMLGPFAKHKGWAPGPIGDWKSGATGWVLWISLAIMLGDSLTSLSLLLITSLKRNIVAIR